jgi:type III secretion protein T
MLDSQFFIELSGRLDPLWFTVLRGLAMSLVFPLFAGRFMTGMVRNCIVFSLALVVYPSVAADFPRGPLPLAFTLFLVAKEILIGATIGFLMGIVFWAIEGMGHLIDFQVGNSMSSMFNPMAGEQSGASSQFLVQLAAALFFASGGMLALTAVYYESFRIWPVAASAPRLDAAFEFVFLDKLDGVMRLAVKFAAPVIIVLLAVELALGLIGRFAQQLNVFFLSQPIKGAVAALVLVLCLAFIYESATDWLLPTLSLLEPLQSEVPDVR